MVQGKECLLLSTDNDINKNKNNGTGVKKILEIH
jgi:hypothetical protein